MMQKPFINIFTTLFAIQQHSRTTLLWIGQSLKRLYEQLSGFVFNMQVLIFNWKPELPDFTMSVNLFAEFLTMLEGNSAHAGSTDLNCILSANFTLFFTIQHYTFCLSTWLNLIFFELQKCYVLLATDTHTQIRKSRVVR